MYIDYESLNSYIKNHDINSIVKFYKDNIFVCINRKDYLKLDNFVKETDRNIYNLLAKKSRFIKINRFTRGLSLYFIYFLLPFYCRDRFKNDPFTIQSTIKIHREIRKRFLLKCFGLSNKNEEIRKLRINKNIHLGEECFVVCTGPSLKISDLDKLKDKYTFGVNNVIEAYSKTTWRPTYYVVQDYKFLKINNCEVFGGKVARGKAFYNKLLNPKTKDESDTYFLLHYKNNMPLHRCFGIVKAKKDISICLYDCFTVANAAIQIALYMGFKKIYLLGVDCDYIGKMYFTNTTEIAKNSTEIAAYRNMVERQITGYKRIKKIAKKFNCEIYNATRGGKLEVFQRIDFDEVINNENSRNGSN